MAEKKRELTQAEKQQAEIAYQQFYEEALRERPKYLQHDIDAHNSEELSRLGQRYGMEAWGRYWHLAELIAGRRNSAYDVSDDLGWERLAWDLSSMQRISVEETKQFIANLAELGLVSKEHLLELHLVTILRVRRDREEYAKTVALKRLGAWKTNQKRLYG